MVHRFTHDYYESIIERALKKGYKFCTMQEFFDLKCPEGGRFVLRHDVDDKPAMLRGLLNREEVQGVRSTVYIRVTGNTYNPFDYRTHEIFTSVVAAGHELGLHSNFLEFAQINGIDPMRALKSELMAAIAFYPTIQSLACHRDYNYVYNSLPWVESHWDELERLGFSYQAYDNRIMDKVIYVNETVNPRLGWRSWDPMQAIDTGRSICMSTHPHWWFDKHPFEV